MKITERQGGKKNVVVHSKQFVINKNGSHKANSLDDLRKKRKTRVKKKKGRIIHWDSITYTFQI